MAKKTSGGPVAIKPIEFERITLQIMGLSPLLSNRDWQTPLDRPGDGEKSVIKRAKSTKEEQFRNSCHLLEGSEWDDGKFVFPIGSVFKSVWKLGGRCVDLPQTQLKASMCFLGDDQQGGVFSFIEGSPPKIFSAVAKTSGMSGAPYMCHRAKFDEWTMLVTVEVMPSIITVQSAVNLIETAGRCHGIGSFRPENGGQYGRFCVTDHSAQVQKVTTRSQHEAE